MNNISEQILQAADILAQKRLSELKYDITVQGTVESLVNLNTGEYKVRYNGNIFSAFSNDLKTTYRIGDNIYIKIPEGDFSNKKLIENKVTDKSLTENNLNELENSVSPVGPTFDVFYNYDKIKEYGVVAGAPKDDKLSITEIFNRETASNFSDIPFLQYANKYEYIKIQADFLTLFSDIHSEGNYGLELAFSSNGEDVFYRLDVSNFNGSPYSFNTYSTQSVTVKIQTKFLTGLKSIKLFEEGFQYDKYLSNGEYIYLDKTTGKELIHDNETNEYYYLNDNNEKIIVNQENRIEKINDKSPNIFVKNIEVQYIEVKNLIDNLYYLRIKTPNGQMFTDQIDEITLQGQLIYNGNSVLTEKNSTCYWYERDYSVMIGDEAYDKNAGFGWRPISANFDTLVLKDEDVVYKKVLKLMVVYSDNVVMSEEIVISNYNTDYNCWLEQLTVGDTIDLHIRNNRDEDELVGDWYLSLPDGSYQEVPNGKQKSEIEVKQYLLYSAVTFYCSIYDKDRKNIIATEEYTITNTESQEDLSIKYIGEDSFRYDSNGDITIEDSEKERTIECQFAWKDGVGTSYDMTWYSPDGSLLTTGERVNPIDSMIENLWVDKYNILHYTIKQKYKINFNNNTIQIKVTTLDQKEYIFNKEILFVKDGDQGTNGTTYIAAIRPCDDNGVKLSGLQPLVFNPLTKELLDEQERIRNDNTLSDEEKIKQILEVRKRGWNTLKLRVYVYKDGELINNLNGNKYTIKYEWSGTNIKLPEAETDDEYISISGNSDPVIDFYSTSDKYEFYIKIKITVREKAGDSTVYLYSIYPIDVAVNGFEYNRVDINEIPSYIKYNSSGLNPSFYSNALKYTFDEIDQTKLVESLNKDILVIEDKQQKESEIIDRYLVPSSNFIFERDSAKNNSSIGILKCPDPQYNTRYLLHSIVMYLDTYGNEAINGWDGTQLDIDNKGKYIFAPQVGAGIKDEQNRFTGVVMGKDSGEKKIGLYGYQAGITTFALMEDGSAFFGASTNGRININGTSAEIYGGLNKNGANSMKLILNDTNISGSTRAININNSKKESAFYVTYNGKMYANNVEVTGNVTATTLTATEKGTIGKFTIEKDWLKGGYIECNNLIANVDGKIGGWTITNQSLKSDSATIEEKDGKVIKWSGTSLYSSGKIYTNLLYANGGDIGGWQINSTNLYGSVQGEYLSYSYDNEGNLIDAEKRTGIWFTKLLKGGQIETNMIHIYGNPTEQGGTGTKIGTMGLVYGSTNNKDTTENVGISSDNGIRIDAAGNIALRALTGSIWLHGNMMAKKGFYCGKGSSVVDPELKFIVENRAIRLGANVEKNKDEVYINSSGYILSPQAITISAPITSNKQIELQGANLILSTTANITNNYIQAPIVQTDKIQTIGANAVKIIEVTGTMSGTFSGVMHLKKNSTIDDSIKVFAKFS